MTDPSEVISGFPPLVGEQPRVLILGSMPGQRSLDKHQYYAHPRNAFWPIMGSLIGFDPNVPYDNRISHVLKAGIAIWDVLYSCQRSGSLDGNIKRESIKINDFKDFLGQHLTIQTVLFNGGTAADLFNRHVRPLCGTEIQALRLIRLPSTSPAHARINLCQKTAEWRKHVHAIQLT